MDRADRAARDAMDLACLLREYGKDTIAQWFLARTYDEIVAACCAAAAMVNIEIPVSQLLAWTDAPAPPHPRRSRWPSHTADGRKVCGHCRTPKPLHAFYRDRSRTDGVGGVCQDCHREKAAAIRRAG